MRTALTPIQRTTILEDFVTGVFRDVVQLVLGRAHLHPGEAPPQITSDDIHFVLQNHFGISISGATAPFPRVTIYASTDDDNEKLHTVRECAGHRNH
jgi:hypothetical protein